MPLEGEGKYFEQVRDFIRKFLELCKTCAEKADPSVATSSTSVLAVDVD